MKVFKNLMFIVVLIGLVGMVGSCKKTEDTALPRITSFFSSNDVVEKGSTITINWVVDNCDSDVIINQIDCSTDCIVKEMNFGKKYEGNFQIIIDQCSLFIITIYNKNGSDQKSLKIEVIIHDNKKGPKADFDFVIDWLNVKFQNSSKQGDCQICTWEWNFGDGQTSNDKNPVHDYKLAGTYDVTLKIVDCNNLSDIIIKKVTVIKKDDPINTPPKANFDYTINELSVVFFDRSIKGNSDIGSWYWELGDGSVSNLQNPNHVYSTSGTYTVVLKIIDFNHLSDLISKNIQVNKNNPKNPPKSKFCFSVDCMKVDFKDCSTKGSGTINSWSWNFGDGLNSNSQNISHSYIANGTYIVTLTIKDTNSLSDVYTECVTIKCDPDPCDNPIIKEFSVCEHHDSKLSGLNPTTCETVKLCWKVINMKSSDMPILIQGLNGWGNVIWEEKVYSSDGSLKRNVDGAFRFKIFAKNKCGSDEKVIDKH